MESRPYTPWGECVHQCGKKRGGGKEKKEEKKRKKKKRISIFIKYESCGSVCVLVCSRFPKPPKVPVSWHFGSMPNLGQLKTWRSPIFHNSDFHGGCPFPYGPVLKLVLWLSTLISAKLRTQVHGNLSLRLFFGPLYHTENRFSKCWFLRGLPIRSSLKNRPLFNHRHSRSSLMWFWRWSIFAMRYILLTSGWKWFELSGCFWSIFHVCKGRFIPSTMDNTLPLKRTRRRAAFLQFPTKIKLIKRAVSKELLLALIKERSEKMA